MDKPTNNDYEDNTKKNIAENLNHYIEQSGKSIYRISKETGIAHSFLYDLIDPEKKKKPSLNMISRLAKYFGIEESDILKNRK